MAKAIRTYNQFYKGVAQDDFLTGGPGVIDSRNIDGITNGYGAVLGPKSNKTVLTNIPMYGFINTASIGDNEMHICGHDGEYGVTDATIGEIYKQDSVDLTPVATISATDTDYFALEAGIMFGSKMYFVGKNAALSSNQVHWADVNLDGTITNWNFNKLAAAKGSSRITCFLVTGTFLYVGIGNTIYQIDSGGAIVVFAIFDNIITGIMQHGTQYVVYQSNGIVSYWDGTSQVLSANQKLGYYPNQVTQRANTDYITTSDGESYIGSGFSVQQITKPKESNRLNDNSQYISKLNFETDLRKVNNGLELALGDIYGISTDSIPGIYKYGKVIEGVVASPNKIITNNFAFEDFEELNSMLYQTETKKLYYSYKTATGYGVDYIDLLSRETAKDGYFVTEVFSAGTTLKKKLNQIAYTTSNTAGANYVKVYYRKNNGSWNLVDTVNNSVDTIARKIMTKGATGEFIDIQLKVELHNDNQDEISPILHEGQYNYDTGY